MMVWYICSRYFGTCHPPDPEPNPDRLSYCLPKDSGQDILQLKNKLLSCGDTVSKHIFAISWHLSTLKISVDAHGADIVQADLLAAFYLYHAENCCFVAAVITGTFCWYKTEMSCCVFRIEAVQRVHSFYSGAVLPSGEPRQHPAAGWAGGSGDPGASTSHWRPR